MSTVSDAAASTVHRALAQVQPCRKIFGASAILLPFSMDGAPAWKPFLRHLLRTVEAGLTPAVNMDTGFGPQLNDSDRKAVIRRTREAIGPETRFIAGAGAHGEPRDPTSAFRTAISDVAEAGGLPILFQHQSITSLTGKALANRYAEVLSDVPEALAFELGTMFAPFGKIYTLDDFRRLLEIPQLTGLKHSSLSRRQEWDRLRLRDQHRPEFRIMTGNDLAIDMVMFGSDYLLGITTFDPHAFALRDRLWEEGNDRFFELNDALQTLGSVAFRDPVPAYKHSALIYLQLRGQMPADVDVHPTCPRRPAWEADLLRPLADRIASLVAAARC